MESTSHNVNLCYTWQELHALFYVASGEDVEKGGRYYVRGRVINVWSDPWIQSTKSDESKMMGSFFVNWIDETIRRIDCQEGFSLNNLLGELAMLEQKALGYVKHGVELEP